MKVRLTTFARPDKDLLDKFSKRYLLGLKSWKDIEFVTDESYDRLVILTYPHGDTLEKGYIEHKALTFMTEPSLSHYAKPHPTTRVMDIHLHLPFFPSDFNIQNELEKKENFVTQKKKLLSVVVSELSGLPGHRVRLRFVYALDQLIDEGLDIFGRPSNGNFFNMLTNYKGFLPDKYEGLWDYRYHVACENCFEEGYFTEKLIDPLITQTLCFYDGCPDIEKYIDPRAYIKLDVHDFENSIPTILKSIRDDEWKKRLPYIQQQKIRFLKELHPFNLIWMAVHNKDLKKVYH